MTTTPTRSEVRQGIREKFATAPAAVDHNGVSDAEYTARREVQDRLLAELDGPASPVPAPSPPGMKPNPAQGASAMAAATGQLSRGQLDRIRAVLHEYDQTL